MFHHLGVIGNRELEDESVVFGLLALEGFPIGKDVHMTAIGLIGLCGQRRGSEEREENSEEEEVAPSTLLVGGIQLFQECALNLPPVINQPNIFLRKRN